MEASAANVKQSASFGERGQGERRQTAATAQAAASSDDAAQSGYASSGARTAIAFPSSPPARACARLTARDAHPRRRWRFDRRLSRGGGTRASTCCPPRPGAAMRPAPGGNAQLERACDPIHCKERRRATREDGGLGSGGHVQRGCQSHSSRATVRSTRRRVADSWAGMRPRRWRAHTSESRADKRRTARFHVQVARKEHAQPRSVGPIAIGDARRALRCQSRSLTAHPLRIGEDRQRRRASTKTRHGTQYTSTRRTRGRFDRS